MQNLDTNSDISAHSRQLRKHYKWLNIDIDW